MKCASCKFRWYGEAPGQINLWRCRIDVRAGRASLPVIGDGSDKALKDANGCAKGEK